MTGKIYCAGAIRGDTTFREFYKLIIETVKEYDFQPMYEEENSDKLTDKEIFVRDIRWLDNSDMLIAEVSGASTGVGFEIAYAIYKLKIPVLALYNEKVKKISAMINGCFSELLTVKEYKDADQLKRFIGEFILSNG